MQNVVAIFLPSLALGGAEAAAVRLANSLAMRGVPVDLLVASNGGHLRMEVSAGVNVVELREGRVLFALGSLSLYLRRAKPEALLAVMTHANLIAVLASRLSMVRTRVILSERVHLSSRVSEGFKGSMIVALAKVLYPFAHGIHAVSHGVARSLTEFLGVHPDRITVIFNGFWAVGNESVISREVDEALETLPRSFVLAAGRLVPQKDFSTLLEAFAIIAEEFPSLGLVIAGDGPLRERLISEATLLGIGGKVHFPGEIRPLRRLMERAEVFVLSSQFEGFGNVLVEAMSAGTPVISSDCESGPSEILEDGKWGTLVEVGNAQAFAQAMRDTLLASSHPDVTHRAENFSMEKMTLGFLKLLGVPDGSP